MTGSATVVKWTQALDPGTLCRMDSGMVAAVNGNEQTKRLLIQCCTVILAGSMCYGFSFGLWRCGLQAIYAALKMPLLIFSITISSTMINVMMAHVMHSGMTSRQICLCIFISLAVTAALLGALSPISLFIVYQCAPADSASAELSYKALLIFHTITVAVCGIAGNLHLWKLVSLAVQDRKTAARVLCSWILVTGLVGCELSWLISPFLARPGLPVPFINPNAFNGNFFEYLWKTMQLSL